MSDGARPGHGLVLLDRQYVDVTGDRVADQVSLWGHKFSPDTVYYNQLYVEVVDGATHRPATIPLPGGYNPAMQFCDFNADGVADIYVSAETGGSSGTSDYSIVSDPHNVPRRLPVPHPLAISGHFVDDYRAIIFLQEQNKPYILDLSERKYRYEQAGYYRNGKLVAPTSVMPNAYSILRPVDPDRNGVCELYGVQRIAGFYNADTIGYATSLWSWNGQRWGLVEAVVLPYRKMLAISTATVHNERKS